MKRLITILLLTLTLLSCKNKNISDGVSEPTLDDIKDFVGIWQSEQNENLVYEIAKINDDTYSLSWKGWMDPAKSDGAFSIPGEMHLGGNENLTLNGNHLDIRGIAIVAYVDENTLYIGAGQAKGNCRRK